MMKLSVDNGPAAKPDAFRLRFLPTFIGQLQNSTSLSLSDSGQYSDYYFAHIFIGAVAASLVKFLSQNDITFLHLHPQQVQPFPIG